jgi:hypothetical protein
VASVAGHQGGLPLTRLLDLIDRYAYKPRHVAWNQEGVRLGLPPDAVTVQIGQMDDMAWYNLRRGVIPEYTVRHAAQVEDDEDVLELLDRMGHIPGNNNPNAISAATVDRFKTTHAPKLKYIGWREVLRTMLMMRQIRGSADAERLLGTREYREVMRKRLLRETVYYE